MPMDAADAILPRRLRFALPEDLPRYWNDNCPVKTHIFNAITILAPAFERLAISSVLPYKDKISEERLANQVSGFIGQESAHGSEFIRFNKILRKQGYDTRHLEKGNLKYFKWMAHKLSPKMHVSLTLAAEHLTAVISDLLLREENWLNKAVPVCGALWRWHAIEEIEHKAVVYDLYQHLGGGYWQRVFGLWCVTVMLSILLLGNFVHLARKDKLIFRFAFWCKCFSLCWGRQGFIRKLILPYLSYLKPGFHPWQQNNQVLINQWRAFFQRAKSFEEMAQGLMISPQGIQE